MLRYDPSLIMTSLRVEGLGKAYHLYKKPLDSLKELFLRRSYHETFWALRDINFAIPAGSSLGIVGENGAGKTTLLQLLAGTLAPSCGKVERHGRISAILELGSGFHADLSGRENIRLGCAMLGLSPGETEQRLPEIIAFSELEQFIDRPVKTYSSGMYLRLAFSVATSIAPDILVVDEHLSVGDEHFRKKCMDRMMAYLEHEKTLVLCSHQLYFIKQICDQCLWLHQGRPKMLGPTLEVIECYQDYERSRDAKTNPTSQQAVRTNGKAALSLAKAESESVVAKNSAAQSKAGRSDDETYLCEAVLEGDGKNGAFQTGGTLAIRVVAHLSPEAQQEGAHLALVIVRNDNVQCYGFGTMLDDFLLVPLNGNRYGARIVIENLPLLAGQYSCSVALMDGKGMHCYEYWKSAAPFEVRQGTKEIGVSRLPYRWEKP
jgi:lipopolysaccharide transport system ATP-binding protein